MLYFDMLEPLQVLPDEEKGRILTAILEYGKDGKEPAFQGMAALAWSFIKPRLDRDEESYENAKVQRRYAAFCKKRSGLNLPKVPFEQWLDMSEDQRQQRLTPDNEEQRSVDFVSDRYPTTTTNTTAATDTTTTTTTNTNTTATTAAAADTGADAPAAAAAERKLKRLHGELGQGVVNLSDYQIDLLLEKMGLELFDHYVKKLSDFILSQGASVKNHYQTILKWWTQDSAP
jgi:hypothetical protein